MLFRLFVVLTDENV